MKMEFEITEIGKPTMRLEPETTGDFTFLRELVKSKIPEIELNLREFVRLDVNNFFAQTHIVQIGKMGPEPRGQNGSQVGPDGQSGEKVDNGPGSEKSAQGGGPPPRPELK